MVKLHTAKKKHLNLQNFSRFTRFQTSTHHEKVATFKMFSHQNCSHILLILKNIANVFFGLKER